MKFIVTRPDKDYQFQYCMASITDFKNERLFYTDNIKNAYIYTNLTILRYVLKKYSHCGDILSIKIIPNKDKK